MKTVSFLVLLMLSCLLSVCQTTQQSGAIRTTDTTKFVGSVIIDSNLKFTKFRQLSDTSLLGIDQYGYCYKITKSQISSWSSGSTNDSAGYGLAKIGKTFKVDTNILKNVFVSTPSYPSFSAPSGFSVSGSGTSSIILSSPGTTSEYIQGNGTRDSKLNLPVSTAQSSADDAIKAYSIQRSNHTGSQSSSTISDFSSSARNLFSVSGSGLSYDNTTGIFTSSGGVSNIRVILSGIDTILQWNTGSQYLNLAVSYGHPDIPDMPMSAFKVWLRADSNVTKTVSGSDTLVDTWNDLSGNGNNFPAYNSGTRPKIVSFLNGKKKIIFDGSKALQIDNFNLGTTNAATVYMVMRRNGVGGSYSFLYGLTNNPFGVNAFCAMQDYSMSSYTTMINVANTVSNGVAVGGTINESVVDSFCVVKMEVNLSNTLSYKTKMFVNGALFNFSDPNKRNGLTGNFVTGTGVKFNIGSLDGTSNFCLADIAEFILIPRVATTTEDSVINLNLNYRYSISPKPTYFAFGDSKTAGYGLTEKDAYPYLFAQSRNLYAINYGIPNTTLEDSYVGGPGTDMPMHKRIQEIPKFRKGKDSLLSFAYTVNDEGYAPDSARSNYRLQLSEIIDSCFARGWDSNHVWIITGQYVSDSWWTHYSTGADTARYTVTRTAASQVATQKGCKQVDFYPYLKANGGDSNLQVDGGHENQAGYILDAAKLNSVVP